VRLADGESARLAAFLELSDSDFIQRHTRLTFDRHGLALQERSNGECIFLEGNDCTVQPVKPQQCRDFPNLWNFPGAEESCRAVQRQVGSDELIRLVADATERLPTDVAERLQERGG
jgi:Fe-S-cluster containining protein